MKISLQEIRFACGSWRMSAEGTFLPGVHIVSGDVGSGKSTLATAIAGLTEPTGGVITGEGISSKMLSFQFPEYHVTGFTVEEECRSWSRDPDRVLAECRLGGRSGSSPLRLSRGELKRLHLACVLAGTYDLLVLDEPFSALDVAEKERICRAISSRTNGITIIFTHEQAVFPRTDYLWEIQEGRLRYRGAVPGALPAWQHAPAAIRDLIAAGKCPHNITTGDLLEAACRT